MKFKKSVQILFLTAVSIFMLAAICSPAYAYTMENADVNITVAENGIVYVHEIITFRTESYEEFREAYRFVQTNSEITIHNATGYLVGYENNTSFRVDKVQDGYELICRLPQPTPRNIVFVISYEYHGGLVVYDDITEFNYNIWGHNWGEPIQNLNANITFLGVPNKTINGEDTVLYWSHPFAYTTVFDDRVVNETANSKTINFMFNAKNIPSYTRCDVRIVSPRMESPDSAYVRIIPENGLSQIINEEKEYARTVYYSYIMMFIESVIILGGILVSIFIYFKYGKEYKTDYNGLYERELPTDTKPALINAIIKGHGKPDMNAFVSTIMSLVDRDYLSISEIDKISSRGKVSKEVILKFEKQPDSNLDKIETDVYFFLRGYVVKDEIVWKDFQKKLGSNDKFYNFLNKWYASVSKASNFSSYFEHKGNNLITGAGIGVIVLSILMYFLSEIVAPSNIYPSTAVVGLLCFLGGFLGVGLILYPLIFKKSMGRWTKDGRVFFLKWQNFEKYLTDYSLIEKYPPASIIIWDHYIVYAMALGVAETALKNMKLASPVGQMERSHFHYIYYYPFFYSGMRSSYSSSVPKNNGGGGGLGGFGGGGIGGGFGGGGGGLR